MSSKMKQIVMELLCSIHFLITVATMCLCWLHFYQEIMLNISVRYCVILFIGYAVILIALNRIYQCYEIRFCNKSELIYSQFLSELICACFVFLITIVIEWRLTNPLPILGVLVVQFIWNFLWVILSSKIYFSIHTAKKTILIFRNNDDKKRLIEASKYGKKFSVIGEFCVQSEEFDSIQGYLSGAEVVFVAGVNANARNGILKYCIENGIIGYIVPHVGDVIMSGGEHIRSFSNPMIRIRRSTPSAFYLLIKRLFDIIVSLLAMVVLSPFMLITALAIKFYDNGPVLYKQIRLTKDGRQFKILKFRSMKVNAEKDGVARLSTQHDDRITPVGKIIRAIRFA